MAVSTHPKSLELPLSCFGLLKFFWFFLVCSLTCLRGRSTFSLGFSRTSTSWAQVCHGSPQGSHAPYMPVLYPFLLWVFFLRFSRDGPCQVHDRVFPGSLPLILIPRPPTCSGHVCMWLFVILLYCLKIVSCRSNFLFPALPFMFLPSPLNFCLLFPSLTNPYCLSSTSPLLLLLFFFNSQASEFSCSRFVSLVGFEAVRHFFWHPMDLLAPFSSLHSSPS